MSKVIPLKGQTGSTLARRTTHEALDPEREKSHPKKMANMSYAIHLILFHEDFNETEILAPLEKDTSDMY